MKIYSNKPKFLKEQLFDEALKATDNQVKNVAVGVRFVSPLKIRSLNKKARGIDRVTDVLSFPMLEGEKRGFLRDFDSERDPFSGELYLGDIVICLRRAKKQAKEFGHSLEREVCFLSLHGLLHLLGFDHIEQEDEKEMQALSENLLSKFGIKR